MSFATIYARKDGTFRVVMGGPVTSDELGGAGRWTSHPFPTEQRARCWVRDGVQHYGIPNMPEPRVITFTRRTVVSRDRS